MEKNYYIFISVLVFGTFGVFSYPGGNSEAQVADVDLNFYRHINENTRAWLNNLSAKWKVQGNSRDVQYDIYDYLERRTNPYLSALQILVNTHDFYNTNSNSSLAMTVIENFRGWLGIHFDLSSQYLEPRTQLAAFRLVNTQNYKPLKKKVAEAYEFEADSTSFISLTKSSTRAEKHEEEAQRAISEQVQGSFEEHKTLLLSLTVRGKMKEVVKFMRENRAAGKTFVIYMDRLIGAANASQIFHQLIESNAKADENDWPMKFRAIKENIYQLIHVSRLSERECPNIYQYRRETMLCYFVRKYREERDFRDGAWVSTVKDLVGSYRRLKLLLVKELNRSGDFKEGLYWAQYYSIPMKEWISDIRNFGTIDSLPADSSSSSSRRRLPKITLPLFFGEYSSWPLFRDLFTSTVIDNARITKAKKMEYLRMSLSGAAAELIENLPVSADSFDSAWALLASRFENQRLLVSSQLDKLTNVGIAVSGSAESINALLATITDALYALDALGSPVSQWDQLLVHIVTQQLDLPTWEAWQVQVGSSNEYPSFDGLKSFLTERVRALERLESSSVGSSSTGEPEAPYPCDFCLRDHYLVRCPTFIALSNPLRLNIVKYLRLCYNCLGHHPVSYCRTNRICKECGLKHHTLLHSGPARDKL